MAQVSAMLLALTCDLLRKPTLKLPRKLLIRHMLKVLVFSTVVIYSLAL